VLACVATADYRIDKPEYTQRGEKDNTPVMAAYFPTQKVILKAKSIVGSSLLKLLLLQGTNKTQSL
jgi:hypothetical protein